MSNDTDLDVKELVKDELNKSIDILHPKNNMETELITQREKEYDILPKWRKLLLIFKPQNTKVFLLQIVFCYLIYSTSLNIIQLIFEDPIEVLPSDMDKDGVSSTSIYILLIIAILIQFIIIKTLHFYATKFQRS